FEHLVPDARLDRLAVLQHEARLAGLAPTEARGGIPHLVTVGAEEDRPVVEDEQMHRLPTATAVKACTAGGDAQFLTQEHDRHTRLDDLDRHVRAVIGERQAVTAILHPAGALTTVAEVARDEVLLGDPLGPRPLGPEAAEAEAPDTAAV